ncbi:MAG: mechanosensitive ion channel [Rickettsiales bacterium]|nr:mechanosensitive ion channel [Rickettsiales bacterium]
MNQDMLLQEILPPLKAAYETIAAAVFSPSVTYQVAWLFVSLVGGLMLSRYPTRWCDTFITQRNPHAWVVSLLNAFRAIILPLITLLFLGLYLAVGLKLSLSGNIISIAANLASVWIVIRFSSSFVRKPWLAKWIAILAMAAATLNILGLLDTVITQLEAIGFQLGKTRISIFGILKSLLFLFLFLWGANMLSGTLERKIQSISEFTPSLRVLLAKLFRITLVTIAILFGLNTLGIDLTAFAVFSGAVGVGLGFGLQKVVSNFISGIILLMDRSIKPGDVVVVDNTFGWVNSLHARYVSVITRDGKEHLIPNELLITEKVENW